MRTHIPKLMLLGLGGGIAAYMFSRRHQQSTPPTRSDLFAPDPADPVQSMDALDQVDLDDLDVDALSMAEGTGEIERATLESSLEESAMELDAPEGFDQASGDVGNLYGVPTRRAEDRLHPDDDRAMAEGQNWIEALETSAAENGPVPEQPIDASVDDEDFYGAPPPSDSEDTPVADRGSGGPGGI